MKSMFGVLAIFIVWPALAGDLDKYKPAPPEPKSDLQRSLENPVEPNPPPTALEKLERGEIPSSENKAPSGGLSPTFDPPGLKYEKSY
ncbi:MAG: hypothetical protein U1E20_00335 [Methylocystis sp.]|jgi:hypothetical protein|uniref:hypothetical protein n=1 Tax=Methylocystis sp. TaxID=1911079 RepID=UPI00396034B2